MGKASDGAAKHINTSLSAKDEAKELNQAKAKAGELKVGDICYVISSAWFRSWEAYCESEEGKPEEIDNNSILEPRPQPAKGSNAGEIEDFMIQLQPGLVAVEDYTVLSDAEWLLLSKWYAPPFPLLEVVGYPFRAITRRKYPMQGVIQAWKFAPLWDGTSPLLFAAQPYPLTIKRPFPVLPSFLPSFDFPISLGMAEDRL